MRCVWCHENSGRRKIRDKCCAHCGKPFALVDYTETPIRDYLVFSSLERVSRNGVVFYGREHLYQEVRRRLGRRMSVTKVVAFSGAIFFLLAVVVSKSALVSVPLTLAVCALLWLYLARRRIQGPAREAFRTALSRYIQVHGALKKFVQPRSEFITPPVLEAAAQEELARYSFDRAVICDRAETVDVLIANQFHFENNCAVLGVEGYPPESFELVRRMLRNNPRLVVVTVHDATEAGCRMAYRVRNDARWFRGLGSVVDVGLRPMHAKFFPRQHERREGEPVAAGQGISASEAEWLSKYSLSLGVLTPEQLIKRLFRAIHSVEATAVAGAAADAGSGGFDPVIGDVILFGSHAEASDGGGDSFG